jgi:hypothetical protein
MAITDNFHDRGLWTMIGPIAVIAGAGNGRNILPSQRWTQCVIQNTGTVVQQWAYTLADAEGALGQIVLPGAVDVISDNDPNLLAHLHIHVPGVVNGSVQLRFLEIPGTSTADMEVPGAPVQNVAGDPLVPGATL